MKILITGGAGFIGSHIAASYLEAGHDVAIVDNLSTGRPANVPASAKFFCADITDAARLDRIFREFRPETVSHHAAQMDIRRSLREPILDANINVVGSLAVLEASVQYRVKEFIFASSGGAVYGEPRELPADESTPERPISHYGVAKLCVERYLHAYHHLYGLKFTTLRYANVFGPRQNPRGEAGVVSIFIRQMLQGEIPTIFGDGSKTRDYVFVEDVVSANLLALGASRCGTFNIGRGVQVSDYEIFSAIRQEVGFADEPKFGPPRTGEVEHICVNAEAAASVLRWKPVVNLRDGIKRTVAYVRSELKTAFSFQAADERAIEPSVSELQNWSKVASQR